MQSWFDQPVSTRHAWTAAIVAFVGTMVVAAVLPFARTPIPSAPATVAIAFTVAVLGNALTATFLFQQFHQTRRAHLAFCTAAFVFATGISVMELITFPGLFTHNGLMPHPQARWWLHALSQTGFPLLLLISMAPGWRLMRPTVHLNQRRIWAWLIVLAPLVPILALAAAFGLNLLPPLMANASPAQMPSGPYVWMVISAYLVLAMLLVINRRSNRVIDMWLGVSLVFQAIAIMVISAAELRYTLGWYVGRFALCAASLALLGALLWGVQAMYRTVFALNIDLRQQADRDDLTGVHSRRYFDRRLPELMETIRGTGKPFAVLLIDIDHFKSYNDTFGHPSGDRCLIEVATAMSSVADRDEQFVARYGGEEFVAVLPNTPPDRALQVGEALRNAVESLAIAGGAAARGRDVSVSIGLAALDRVSGDMTSEAVLRAADMALYEAKRGGRNRVVWRVLTRPSDRRTATA